MFKYYWGSILFTVIGLALGGWLGWNEGGTLAAVGSTLFIVAVLSVLEVSLSFDNAIVNASVLKTMTPFWRKAFLTWGILIAVFGMRIVFPLLIVGIAARLGPIDALNLAINEPERYEEILEGAHVGIAAFGGAFLAMVGLKFFFDSDKEVHWIAAIERQLSKFSNVEAVEIGFVLLCLYGISTLLPGEEPLVFITAGIFGLLTFIGVEAIGNLLEGSEAAPTHGHGGAATTEVARAGLGAFLYLEVLDASFSFDGVIGAFALSNNLFIIAIGLGIGAMFVRSMTIMLVDKGTLSQYRYLEHGAFYAILALAAIMLLSARYEIPEVVTGLLGAILIGLSLWASVRYNKANPGWADEEEAAGEDVPVVMPTGSVEHVDPVPSGDRVS